MITFTRALRHVYQLSNVLRTLLAIELLVAQYYCMTVLDIQPLKRGIHSNHVQINLRKHIE